MSTFAIVEIFLTLLMIIIFGGLIVRHPWFRYPQLSAFWRLLLWVLFSGVFLGYGWFHAHFYGGGDTFRMFANGMALYDVLWQDPVAFLRAMAGSWGATEVPSSLQPYTEAMGYWQHPGSFTVVRLHALFRFFSFGYYYVQAVWFAFALFLPWFQLLKTVSTYRTGRVRMHILLLLGLPSAFFFTHGMHKEAIVLVGLSLMLHHMLCWQQHRSGKHLAGMIIALLIINSAKEFYLFALLLPWLAWWIASLSTKQRVRNMLILSVLFMGLFSLVLYCFHPDGVLGILSDKQAEFMVLKGNSNIPLPRLDGWATLPQVLLSGIGNVCIRPLPWHWEQLTWALYGIENYIVLAITPVIVLLFFRKIVQQDVPLLLMMSIFLLLALSVIGIIVPIFGAIVRYKAPAIVWLSWIWLIILTRPKEDSPSKK